MEGSELTFQNRLERRIAELPVRLRRILGRVGLSLALITGGVAIENRLSQDSAAASGTTAEVDMPFTGQWAYNQIVYPDVNGNYSDTTSSHPSIHHAYYGDWATDLYKPAGTDVKLHVNSTSGSVSFSLNRLNDSCSSAGPNLAGHGIVLNVIVNGSTAGSIDFEHLDNIPSGPYTNGMTIGKITSEPFAANCYTARHTHVELKNNTPSTYSCWTDNGYPGTVVNEGRPIGILGSPNTGPKQKCFTTPPSPPSSATNRLNKSGEGINMPGHWVAGDSGQDFAYITEGSDHGFAIALWEQTPTGLVWKGVKQSIPGTSGVTYENTKFVATDMDGDGLMDLYYATSSDWTKPGFSMALFHNNGNGLDYWGQQWNPTNIALGDTKFLPGDWVGNGRGAFAYVTRSSDQGFAIAEFKSTPSGLVWNGVKWSSPGSSGVTFNNTKFIPVDMDGDGKMDLYYATSQNWNQTGFAVGLEHNNGNGFDWWGTQWAPNNIALGDTRFIPGFWAGTGREGFAYITKSSDQGFALASFDSTVSGLIWKGVWMSSAGSSQVDYENTEFVPADMDNDGKTDLLYATSINWTSPGFAMALMHNRGNGFDYLGQQWNPINISLGRTTFMPEG